MDWEAIGVISGFVVVGAGLSAWLHKIYRIADMALNEIRHLNGLLTKLEIDNKDDHAHIWQAIHENAKGIRENDRRITRLEPK